MTSANTCTTLILLLCLAGCGAPVVIVDYYATDSESLRRYSQMEIIDASDPQAAGYQRIGRAKGIYCQKGMAQTGDMDMKDAIDQVKLKAAKQGATYISTPACTVQGLDMTNNCFHTIVCQADALTKN